MVTMSLPGVQGMWAGMRIPLCVVDHKHVLKGDTFDTILGVMVWSLCCAAINICPTVRHDGADFVASDKKRAKWGSSAVGVHGIIWYHLSDFWRLEDVQGDLPVPSTQ